MTAEQKCAIVAKVARRMHSEQKGSRRYHIILRMWGKEPRDRYIIVVGKFARLLAAATALNVTLS
eukprot:scaffold13691_cov156-Amphora_coffeaeformis.AAC.4